MASGVGRQMLRDILAATDSANAEKCGTYTRYQLSVFIARAEKDREPFPTLEELMDHVISPIIYRILFDQMPAPNYVRDLIAKVMLKG